MTDRRPYRVVVADDVADLRLLLRLTLERDGRFEVVAEAADGAQAVRAAEEHRPDLALLDLSMPVMDGLEALPPIRAALPDGVVVVLSGFDADRMRDRVSAGGADAYIAKGIEPDHLVEELLRLLEPEAPSTADELVAVVELPESVASGRDARRFIERNLEAWGCAHVLDGATLLATELVSNAVLHARSAVELTARFSGRTLRVEVADTGGGALQLRDPDDRATSGRGLLLVEAMSSAWGTSADGVRKVVWFELST